MIEVYALNDKAEYFERAVHLFWKQWGNEKNFKFYQDCMLHSMNADRDLPSFYIALENELIVGTSLLLKHAFDIVCD